MEKRATTTEKDVRELVKLADVRESMLVVNLDGLIKFASGRHKPAVAIVATGERADLLRKWMREADIAF